MGKQRTRRSNTQKPGKTRPTNRSDALPQDPEASHTGTKKGAGGGQEQKPRRRSPGEQKDLLGSEIEIRTLAMARDCHRLLTTEEGVHTLTDAAYRMGLKYPDTLYHQIELFEQAFGEEYGERESGCKIFLRRSGRGAKTTISRHAEPLFHSVDAWLEQYQAMLARSAFTIRLGAGMQIGMHLLPMATRAWRESCTTTEDQAPPPIRISHGKPQELEEKVLRGELDLVVLSHNQDERYDPSKGYEFRLHLIVPAGDPLAVQSKELVWSDLKGYTVVLLDPVKRLTPGYPRRELLEAGAQLIEVESYLEACSLVMAGGKVAGFACPQLLDEEHRRRLDVVPIPEDLWPQSLWFEVRLSQKSLSYRSEAEQGHIRSLEAQLLQALERARLDYTQEYAKALTGHRWVYHVTRTDAPDNKPFWHKSRILLRGSADGLVKGEHWVHPPEGYQKEALDLDVFGYTQQLRHQQDDIIGLFFRGRAKGAASDHYGASLIADEERIGRGLFVGYWIGRQTWVQGGDLVPYGGFMIITDNEYLHPRDLNGYVDRYLDRYGRWNWEKSDQKSWS